MADNTRWHCYILVPKFFLRTNLESWEGGLEFAIRLCFYELRYGKYETAVKKKLYKQQFTENTSFFSQGLEH